MSDSVLLRTEGEIAVVLLNRQECFNAFDGECIGRLAQHLTELATDATVRGVVLSGIGKAFCAGGDLKAVSQCPEGASVGFYRLAAVFHRAVLEIRRMSKPVIAAINGAAAGGGFALALACDFRVMAHSAVLRQAYTAWGLCIDGAGTFTLPRLVGLARALEIAAFQSSDSGRTGAGLGVGDECGGRRPGAGRGPRHGARIGEGFDALVRVGEGLAHEFI